MSSDVQKMEEKRTKTQEKNQKEFEFLKNKTMVT